MSNILNRLGNSNDSNEKVLNKLVPIVEKINALEAEYKILSDDELKRKTQEFKNRLAIDLVDTQKKANVTRQQLQGAKKSVAEAQDKYMLERGEKAVKQLEERIELIEKELSEAQNEALDNLLPEAFAAVREAARRTIGQRHNDVQLIGGIVLHQEKVAEVKNGEGMALIASLPLYLNALLGKGVHFVSLNNYLSKRDSYGMGPIYFALGMSISSIQGQQNAGGQVGVSFIFDPNYYSGKEDDPWKHFRSVTRKAAYLADITYGTNNEFGFDYLRDNVVIDLNQCVQRDLYYAILGEVDIILVEGGRTPLIINGPPEGKTFATITFQNYFDMYQRLAGMTNTAFNDAEEFHDIHLFDVVIIPANRPTLRQDFIDKIYKNEEIKFNQVVKEVEDRHKEGRPILIGTVSPEKSEVLSDLMKRNNIPHEVLNTKLDEKEAAIIAQAGRMGAVVIATDILGYDDDIILGGNPAGREPKDWQKEHDGIVRLGGLHVIGTEHHEERRRDNKLRGLAGCHGEPGSTQFYISLDDKIIRRFGGDRVGKFVEWAELGENVSFGGSFVYKSIEFESVRAEHHYFELRKQLVEYDNVLNNQCKFIYDERRKILNGADLKAIILSMVKEEMAEIIANHIGKNSDGNLGALVTETGTIMYLPSGFNAEALTEMKPAEIKEKLMQQAEALYEKRETELVKWSPKTGQVVKIEFCS
jgi:preprotein translocase subunit SecA